MILFLLYIYFQIVWAIALDVAKFHINESDVAIHHYFVQYLRPPPSRWKSPFATRAKRPAGCLPSWGQACDQVRLCNRTTAPDSNGIAEPRAWAWLQPQSLVLDLSSSALLVTLWTVISSQWILFLLKLEAFSLLTVKNLIENGTFATHFFHSTFFSDSFEYNWRGAEYATPKRAILACWAFELKVLEK